MTDSEEPKRQLLAGVESLDPIFIPAGFVFSLEGNSKGSGGWFASGSYRRGERRLELHFRYSLGLVRYHIGNDSLDHETYMRCLGRYGSNQYPDFPKDPLESFVRLASDISTFCGDFLSGDGTHFLSCVQRIKENPNLFKGIAAT